MGEKLIKGEIHYLIQFLVFEKNTNDFLVSLVEEEVFLLFGKLGHLFLTTAFFIVVPVMGFMFGFSILLVT